jgi:hypothetical protein
LSVGGVAFEGANDILMFAKDFDIILSDVGFATRYFRIERACRQVSCAIHQKIVAGESRLRGVDSPICGQVRAF